jgi:hypothetical protein
MCWRIPECQHAGAIAHRDRTGVQTARSPCWTHRSPLTAETQESDCAVLEVLCSIHCCTALALYSLMLNLMHLHHKISSELPSCHLCEATTLVSSVVCCTHEWHRLYQNALSWTAQLCARLGRDAEYGMLTICRAPTRPSPSPGAGRAVLLTAHHHSGYHSVT